jgi:hypothetical protein
LLSEHFFAFNTDLMILVIIYAHVCVSGKVVPEEAVLEMKMNYSLPTESDEHVDEVIWIELPRDKSEEMVET